MICTALGEPVEPDVNCWSAISDSVVSTGSIDVPLRSSSTVTTVMPRSSRERLGRVEGRTQNDGFRGDHVDHSLGVLSPDAQIRSGGRLMQHRHRRTAHPRRLAGKVAMSTGLSGENADRDAAIDTDLGQAAGHAPSLLVDVAPGLTESVVRLSRHQAAVGDCGGRIHLFGELAQRNSSVSVTLRSVQLFAGHKWLCVRTHTYMDNQRSFAECYAAVAIASWSASILSLLCCCTLHLSAHRHVAGTDAHFERFFVDYPVRLDRPFRLDCPVRHRRPRFNRERVGRGHDDDQGPVRRGRASPHLRRHLASRRRKVDADRSAGTAREEDLGGRSRPRQGRPQVDGLGTGWRWRRPAAFFRQFHRTAVQLPLLPETPDEQINVINLVDTPGHSDFSEDTYRVLTAVDAAVMLIDAAKGLEPQDAQAVSGVSSPRHSGHHRHQQVGPSRSDSSRTARRDQRTDRPHAHPPVLAGRHRRRLPRTAAAR